MKYIPEIILAISTCALGIGASAFIKEDNRHIISIIAGTLGIVALFAFFITFIFRMQREKEIQNNNTKAFLTACRTLIEKEDYDSAMQILQIHGVNDAPSSMIYAYMLANGYGIDTDIQRSIHYYKAAREMGDKRAETNMVVSVVKNCPTPTKIEVLKSAYGSGNEIAIKYVDYVVKSYNSTLENGEFALSSDQIWNMDEEELLAVLNGPFYAWVGSNVTYSTTMSVSSTPTFTRTFLYKSGESYVYEECSLIARSSFPDWLQEDIW